jgi:hypothetical protein
MKRVSLCIKILKHLKINLIVETCVGYRDRTYEIKFEILDFTAKLNPNKQATKIDILV